MSDYHICPYCGHEESMINDHFTHIEFFHPEMPLVPSAVSDCQEESEVEP
jgi:hypothetical protein